ncbi:hypothetical protein RJ640_006394 [Escallonia rubra]|uniref:Uncharacterized protein n=1 Tax=Escallonia rubra TaxID=112253 RepID=A0AA88SFR4_9ASTE|nr:hypothetical protein RJ640_006394 [Escallonia rubra]
MGALQSLLPLHSAVSSARLTSCLGIDSKGSRSLSQDGSLVALLLMSIRVLMMVIATPRNN